MPRRHFCHSAQPCSVRASGGSAGTSLRPDDADDGDPDAEQRDLDDARADRAGIHVADRAAELVGQHDQHQRGRDELGDGAGRGDDARGVARRIAVAASSTGSEITPMAMTEAATVPVMAPRMAPTKITA